MRSRVPGLLLAALVTLLASPLGQTEAIAGPQACPHGTNWDVVRHICR